MKNKYIAAILATSALATMSPNVAFAAEDTTPSTPVESGTQKDLVPASALDYQGIYKPDGSRLDGHYDAIKDGFSITDGWTVKLEATLDDFKPGGFVDFFIGANEKELSGGGLSFGQIDNEIKYNGVPTLRVKSISQVREDGNIAYSGIRITGLDNVNDVTGKISVPVHFYAPKSFYGSGDGMYPKEESQTKVHNNQPIKYYFRTYSEDKKTPSYTPVTKDGNATLTWKQAISEYPVRYFRHWMAAPSIDNDKGGISLRIQHNFPRNMEGGKGYVKLTPNESLTPWNVSDPSTWKVTTRAQSAKDFGEEPFSEEELKKFASQIKTNVKKDGKGFIIEVSNVPEDVTAIVFVDNIGYVDIGDPADYGASRVEVSPTKNTKNGGQSTVKVQGLLDAEGNAIKAERKPSGVITINGKETTKDTPAMMESGKKTKGIITLKNEGNTRLSNPNITGPDGKTFTADTSIAPGETADVEVEFTPEEKTTEYVWNVSYSNAKDFDLKLHGKFTSESDEHKPSYPDAETKPGVPVEVEQSGDKDIPKGTQFKLKNSDNLQGWKIDIEEDSGKATVTPPHDAHDGDKKSFDVEVEYTDKSTKTVSFEVTVKDESQPEESIPQPSLPPETSTPTQDVTPIEEPVDTEEPVEEPVDSSPDTTPEETLDTQDTQSSQKTSPVKTTPIVTGGYDDSQVPSQHYSPQRIKEDSIQSQGASVKGPQVNTGGKVKMSFLDKIAQLFV